MPKLLFLLTAILPTLVQATDYELIYKEEEPGVEPYINKIIVSERYLRADDLSDDSGYVLYDDSDHTVYSVSHFDRTILVIKRQSFDVPALSDKLVTRDVALSDAPKISGNTVHDYRVELETESIQEMCTHIQYAATLFPVVGDMLHGYQLTLAGNHVRTLDQVPMEYQTPCMLSDQVYFDGAVYTKGLPIMEWHSNGKKKLLQSFKKKDVKSEMFELPEDYRRYSLN